MSDYQSADDYIRGEYGGELPVVRQILKRNLPVQHLMGAFTEEQVERLAYDIVGYFTGCLRADGTKRVPRSKSG